MTLHQLKVWNVVAKYESMTIAADRMSVRQPTVTMQVRELQKEFRRKLYRNAAPKGLEITPAGRLLAKYAKRFDHLEKQLRSRLGAR